MKFFVCENPVPREMQDIQKTIKLAFKPWNHFIVDDNWADLCVNTPMVNIVSKEYIPDLASAIRVANFVLHTIHQEIAPEYYASHLSSHVLRTDNGLYFRQSTLNLFATVLYYFVHKFPLDGYGDYKQVDMPHVVAFLQLDAQTVLEVLETCDQVGFFIEPFIMCYKHKAFDQFDAMWTTLLTDLAPFATPENFWLLSHQNTSGKKEVRFNSNWDLQTSIRSNFQQTRRDVRDYVDYLRGLREKPTPKKVVDDTTTLAKPIDEVSVIRMRDMEEDPLPIDMSLDVDLMSLIERNRNHH